MELKDIGFVQFFQEHAEDLPQPANRVARVTAVDRGGGLVRSEEGEVPFELAGRLEFTADSAADLPCVGDWVAVRFYDSGSWAVVHAVLPRRTFLRRKSAGRGVNVQMIAANIDTAFIVQSCRYDFNLHRLDRYIVMAAEGRIEPVILLTKTDLVAEEDVQAALGAIRQAGIAARTLALSSVTRAGIADFVRLLEPRRTYCLLGSSGVGKTTLINRLLGSDAFETREVSATGEGTHTTARRQLIVLEQGAMLVDTPGMRELGVLAAGEGLDEGFGEIGQLAGGCRYADCTHLKEPGCAVRAAVESGALSQDRYQNYVKLRKESEFNELSYVEKRRKDRSFGRFIKSAKKTIR